MISKLYAVFTVSAVLYFVVCFWGASTINDASSQAKAEVAYKIVSWPFFGIGAVILIVLVHHMWLL